MARYVKQFLLSMPPQQAVAVIQQFMQQNGFRPYTHQGETCWKKGNGLLTAPQMIKTTVLDNAVAIEAWIKYALLPGVYVGEMDFNGAMGFALKAALKSKVETLQQQLGYVPGVTPELVVPVPGGPPAPPTP